MSHQACNESYCYHHEVRCFIKICPLPPSYLNSLTSYLPPKSQYFLDRFDKQAKREKNNAVKVRFCASISYWWLRPKCIMRTSWLLAHSPKERILQGYEADALRVVSSTFVFALKGYERERRSAQLTKIVHRITPHMRGKRAELSLFVCCVVALLWENCLRDHSCSSAL